MTGSFFFNILKFSINIIKKGYSKQVSLRSVPFRLLRRCCAGMWQRNGRVICSLPGHSEIFYTGWEKFRIPV